MNQQLVVKYFLLFFFPPSCLFQLPPICDRMSKSVFYCRVESFKKCGYSVRF